ncbi:hypothetical protein D3C78_1639660 [compost metagenome]
MGAVDACSLIEAGAQVEAGLLVTTGQVHAAFPGLVTAKTQVQARLQAWLGAAPGENLDDPANRITAVQHRA